VGGWGRREVESGDGWMVGMIWGWDKRLLCGIMCVIMCKLGWSGDGV
jgi:hypothetical protein